MEQTNTIDSITKGTTTKEQQLYRIKVINPLHVGDGIELNKGIDFATTSDHTVVYDLHKILRSFPKQIDELSEALEQGKVDQFLLEYASEELKDYIKASITGVSHASQIKSQLQDGMGRPMIPGSSIKGAIKSALFAERFKNETRLQQQYERMLINSPKWASQKLQGAIFSPKSRNKRTEPNYDVGRALRISDSFFDDDYLNVYRAKVFNLSGNSNPPYNIGWRDLTARPTDRGKNKLHPDDATDIAVLGISLDAESTAFRFSIDPKIAGKLGFGDLDIERISDLCNRHAVERMKQERHFYEDIARPVNEAQEFDLDSLLQDAEIIQEQAQELLDSDESGFMLQVGWGGGWNNITGGHVPDSYLDDLRKKFGLNAHYGKKYLFHPHFPKTRRIYFPPDPEAPLRSFGWVKLEPVQND